MTLRTGIAASVAALAKAFACATLVLALVPGGIGHVQARQPAMGKTAQAIRALIDKSGERELAGTAWVAVLSHVQMTKGYADYCKGKGISLEPFVTEYSAANGPLYAKAQKVLARNGISAEMMSTMLQEDAGVMRDTVAKTDEATTAKFGSSLCGDLRDTPKEAATAMVFAKSRPASYKMLMDAP